MESKHTHNKPNTPSKETQKSKSIEPKQDSGKKGSNSEQHKIPIKNPNAEKEILAHNELKNKEKSHQTKEHKEITEQTEKKAHIKEETKKEQQHTSKPTKKPSAKGANFDSKESNKSNAGSSTGGKAAPEGFFYNENHELMPVFMKKLAQNKNQNLIQNKQQTQQQCRCEINLNQLNSESNLISKSEEDQAEQIDSQESDEAEVTSAAIKEVHDLLKNNKDWVKETLAKNPEFLKEISAPQHPKYLVISCSDSRILTSKILGTHPGELFVHRNIGNIVLAADFNLQSVLSYAIENLKVKNVIVLGHTDCGAIKTSLSNKYHGLIDHWLKPVKDLVEKNHDFLDRVMKKNPEKLTTKLSELNVKEQVINLCKNPIVQKAWNDGQELYIHGLLFDMGSGFVKDLKTMKKEWRMIEDIHALEFSK